jgi:hypothetical protein
MQSPKELGRLFIVQEWLELGLFVHFPYKEKVLSPGSKVAPWFPKGVARG